MVTDDGSQPERLPGGFVNEVVRLGSTVHRTAPEGAPFVRRVLRRFEEHRWPGAPRFLGVDEDGREILSYIDGHAAWEPAQPPDVSGRDSLIRVAELVREFHDLTAGTALAGSAEVVCHNDLSPKNTIYRDLGAGLRPVAFIDWDLAAPGERVADVALVCWQYLGLGPGITDPPEAARMVRVLADAYGLADRAALVDTILWWQNRCWQGIEGSAEQGDPAANRLRDLGVVGRVRAAHRWTAQHRRTLQRALGVT